MDGVYVITDQETRIVGVNPSSYALPFAADLLECCGNTLKLDKIGSKIIWNCFCRRAGVDEVKLFSFAKQHNKKEVWQLYSLIKDFPMDSFFIILPMSKDKPLPADALFELKMQLISKNTGLNVDDLKKSFETFREDGVGDCYDIIACVDTTKGQKIGTKRCVRRCRFCGRSIADGVTFRKKPHAISRLLGNVSVLGYDECDYCNEQIFSRLENSVAIYFLTLRSMLGVSGRSGIPEIKDNDLSITNFTGHDITIAIDSRLVETVEDGATLTQKFSVDCGKYVPLDLYRMLSKYAISVFPADAYNAEQMQHLSDWVCNGIAGNVKLPIVAEQVTNRWNPKSPRIVVYRRRTDVKERVPLYFCEFLASGLRFFYELPFVEDSVLIDESAWREFMGKMPALFGKDGWSFDDFSSNSECKLVNNIILKGEKKITKT